MGESSAQSMSKCTELSLNRDAVIDTDRISNLPDSLLYHILYFLPTKEAVATTILSKRWKPLWTLVPKLDLRDSRWEKPKSFKYIVNRVLALHIAPSLRSFRLTWHSPCNSFHLDTWIHAALARNVQQLHLEMYLNGGQNDSHAYEGEFFYLPSSLYTCKTVAVLELRGGIVLDPPPSFQFPSLKILRLSKIRYGSMNSISTLISGCPVLEDLSVVRVCTNVISLKIKVHTLKRLHIGFKSYKPEPPDYNLEIHTPALEYFQFSGHLRNIVFHEKLAHLIEARVDIYALEDWTRVYEIYYGDRVFKLLRALNNAKFLSLIPGDKECIAFGSIYPSMFQNVVRLNFKVTPSNWHVLLALLLVAPNLEVLDLNKDCDNENRLCWMELPDSPGCLSSCLTTFNFDGFEELEHEVKFVMYILKEARALNTMTIKIPAKLSKEDVFETLSMFPRLSTTCLITVEKLSN